MTHAMIQRYYSITWLTPQPHPQHLFLPFHFFLIRVSRLTSLWRRSFCSNSNKGNDHIGIDFGSTNRYVTVMDGNNPKLVANYPSGMDLTAKVIQGGILKENRVVGLKRLIGRSIDDPIVQKEMKMLQCKIVRDSDGDVYVETTYGSLLTVQGILALFPNQVKNNVQTYLGKSVSRAVITFPITFPITSLEILKFPAPP